MARKLSIWGGILLLLAAYVMLANDGRHHWHEFRDLYSATFYSTTDLMQGVFDAGPAPLRTPQEVAAWYSTKLFHIYLLRQLVAVFGMGLTSFHVLKALYVGTLLVGVGLIGATLLGLGVSRRRTALIIGLLIFSPGIVYLGFKLMPEAPALLFASAALALFTQGLGSSSRQILLSGLAGLALAVSALASWTVPFLFFGFWSALALLGMPTSRTRKPMALASVATWTSFAASLIIGLWLLGGSLPAYVDGIAASFSFTKPLAMWMFAVFNVGLLGMGLWLLVPLAWISRDGQTRRFFVVWLALSALPVLGLTAGFMEPRYLTAATVPFIGLAALGAEGLWERLPPWTWWPWMRAACMAVLSMIVIGGTAAAQSLMPYEADTKRLIEAVQAEAPSSESTVIFVPWNYSDFHFLRFVFPERPIYLVQSAANERGEMVQDPAWASRYASMYGSHFLPNAEAFRADFLERKLLYIGWTILPSLQNVRDLLLFMGRARLPAYLESSQFLNHMTQSWLLQDTRLRMHEVSRYGQYHVYQITPRLFPRHWNQMSAISSPPTLEVPLWGIFETSFIKDASHYKNPFVDTELEATFLSPSGRTYNFSGFYDGDGKGGQVGNIWKLRFMCVDLGTWGWAAKFIDGSPGGSGSFNCVESALPGPLRVDTANHRWLTRANGAHFFPRWYYLHELLFTREGLWQQDVDTLAAAHGYNMVTVLTVQAEHLIAQGWNKREYDHPVFYPWVKDGKTVLWNTPDLASWHKMDRVLKYLQERQIYVYFFDGFFPKYSPRFPDDPVTEQLYLRYALSRMGVYWNVLHNIAFEFSHYMPTSRVKRIGRYIDSIDPFNLLLTVHDTQDFNQLVEQETWLDLSNVQYYMGTADSASVSNAFILNQFPGKPVAATEVVWEGTQKLYPEQVRRGAWGILTAGSFFLYGEFDINGRGVGEFGAGQAHPFLKILFDFIEDIPYWTMSPHNNLVNARAFCLANPGRDYVIYAEEGGPITVDLSAAWSSFEAQWVNPRTGERTRIGKVIGGTIQTFTNPSDDKNDWVLHIYSLS
jgi:hypothetical protein